MNTLLQYSLEVGICWAIFYLIYIAFLRKETFFSINRWYLLASLLIGLLIPVLKMIPLSFQAEAIVLQESLYFISAGPELIAANISPISDATSILTLHNLLLLVYCLGTLFMASRLSIGLVNIYNLYSSAQKTKHEHFTLVETIRFHLPFSFGNCVFFSKKLPLNGDVEKILKHELTHVKSWHTVDVLFIEILQVLFWFNPLIYLYKKAIKESHEYVADATVLKDTSQKIYGQILLRQSQSGLQIALANHFFHSHIKKRLTMMKQKKSKRPALMKYLMAVPFILLLAVLFQSQIIPETNAIDKVENLKENDPPKKPLSLVEGVQKELSQSERKKYKGVEILTGDVAVKKFGDIAKNRTVFNLLDTEDYVFNTNDVQSRIYLSDKGWRFEYVSEARGKYRVRVKDKDFQKGELITMEKTSKILDFPVSQLNSTSEVFQIFISDENGNSIETAFVDFRTGKSFNPFKEYYIASNDEKEVPIDQLLQKARELEHNDLFDYWEAEEYFQQTNQNGGKPMLLVNVKKGNVEYIHPEKKENNDGKTPTLIPIKKDKLKKSIENSSGFGMRIHPILKAQKFHLGIDLIAEFGVSVFASTEGSVIETEYDEKFGNHITIKHSNEFSSFYAHLKESLVKKGDTVKKGQRIGLVGSSGISTAPHLHYAVIKNEKHIDPMPYLIEEIQLLDTGLNQDSESVKTYANKPTCKADENGFYYWVDRPPSIESCADVADPEELWKCSQDVFKQFTKENFIHTKEGIERGFEGSLSWKLTIDEKGAVVDAKIPAIFSEYKYGYQEEGERLIEKLSKDFSFIPAECQGDKVKSWLSFGIRVRLSEDQKKLVKVRNSKTVERVNQNLQLSNASSEGNLSITYESNMNVPYSLEIVDPKGNSVYKKEENYMYKRKGDYFNMEKPINGKYTAIAVQDGIEKKTTMDINVYQQ